MRKSDLYETIQLEVRPVYALADSVKVPFDEVETELGHVFVATVCSELIPGHHLVLSRG